MIRCKNPKRELTGPSVLAVVVKVIQILQVLGVDDSRALQPVTRPANGLGSEARWSAHKAVLPLNIAAATGDKHKITD